jgi:outer membrane protein TolC
MTRLEELEAKRAAAEAAVNAAADTAWDEAAAAYAAYDAAWDAVDAYKAELKKQGRNDTIMLVTNQKWAVVISW